MKNKNELTLANLAIFLDGDYLHVIGPNKEEMPVSLYALADHLFNQPIDNPNLIPDVIRGLKNVIEYIENKSTTRTLQ